jgi:hypothetical protein
MSLWFEHTTKDLSRKHGQTESLLKSYCSPKHHYRISLNLLSSSLAHWRMGTFSGNVLILVPRLRRGFGVQLHRERKCRPYWSEQTSVRSGFVNLHLNRLRLWFLSGSCEHPSLSARNNSQVRVAYVSPGMTYPLFYTHVYQTERIPLRECRSDEVLTEWWDLLRMDHPEI